MVFNCFIIRRLQKFYVPDYPLETGVWHIEFCKLLIMKILCMDAWIVVIGFL